MDNLEHVCISVAKLEELKKKKKKEKILGKERERERDKIRDNLVAYFISFTSLGYFDPWRPGQRFQ